MFKIGDIVQIVDPGCALTTYHVEHLTDNPEIIKRYQFGTNDLRLGMACKVIAEETVGAVENKVFVSDDKGDASKIWFIATRGLNLIRNAKKDAVVEYPLRLCSPVERFQLSGVRFEPPKEQKQEKPMIEKVIYSEPATIVIWSDKTKTVVKCGENDIYDKEKGLALCIAKKALGNQGNYKNVFHAWLGKKGEAK